MCADGHRHGRPHELSLLERRAVESGKWCVVRCADSGRTVFYNPQTNSYTTNLIKQTLGDYENIYKTSNDRRLEQRHWGAEGSANVERYLHVRGSRATDLERAEQKGSSPSKNGHLAEMQRRVRPSSGSIGESLPSERRLTAAASIGPPIPVPKPSLQEPLRSLLEPVKFVPTGLAARVEALALTNRSLADERADALHRRCVDKHFGLTLRGGEPVD